MESLKAEMVGEERSVIEIRRSHVLQDAMKEARKSKFSPNKYSKVFLTM